MKAGLALIEIGHREDLELAVEPADEGEAGRRPVAPETVRQDHRRVPGEVREQELIAAEGRPAKRQAAALEALGLHGPGRIGALDRLPTQEEAR